MKRIKRLDQETISRISAGEVILRPSNVVKELIENSIDASANFIEVEIKKGGKEYIRVTDNGTGIDKDDLPLTIERYTTSKLEKIDDLDSLTTLGFRGEALASIAAVSELTIITTRNGMSYKLEVIDSNKYNIVPAAAPDGTTVIVKNIFYNIPVRKKFLKTDQTETLSIVDIFLRYVLSFPNIHFRLIVNEKINQEYFSQSDYVPRIISALGENSNLDMLRYESTQDGISINIIGSNYTETRSDYKSIYTFVNKRFVNDRLLKKAIIESYEKILPPQRYPITVLFLKINPDEVDVNIHPHKTEIRFKDPNRVYRSVLKQITDFVSRLKPANQIDYLSSTNIQNSSNSSISNIRETWNINNYGTSKRHDKKPSFLNIPESSDIFEKSGYFSSLEILGQFQDRFIILASNNSLVIIDQHAAQERILYNKIITDSLKKRQITQRLLIPINIELSPVEVEKLRLFIDDFKDIGFEIDIFGERNAIIKGIPVSLNSDFSGKTFIDILDDADEEIHNLERESIIQEIAARTACHSSVRGRKRLNDIEIRRLLIDMDKTDFSIACPHGRPVFFEISSSEIETRFLRK